MKKFKAMNIAGKIIIPCAILVVSLAGCGSNIFKGLSDEQLPENTTSLIESGHYEEAISKADAIINNPDSTAEEKQLAYADKGLAILAKNNISLGQVASVAGDYTTASDFLSGGLEKLDAKLSITVDEAKDSADMLNAAHALSESGTTTPSVKLAGLLTLPPSLNSTAQFRRAFANATVVIKMATLYLDITEDGATLNSLAKAYGLTITDVFVYLNSSSRNVYYYAANAYDGAIKSNALTTTQLSAVENALEAAYNMNELYKCYTNGTVFKIKNRSGVDLHVYTSATFSGLTGAAKETLLKEALTAIYNEYR